MTPSCYNHPPFIQEYHSKQFPWNIWTTKWNTGCPHWKPGGNAQVLSKLIDRGGIRLDWKDCEGCSHR